MSKISWLERQIDIISGFVAEDEAALANKPGDFGLRLVVNNKRQHIDSLRHELMLAQAERDKEVMELRLMSPAMERGAIPLRFLARLSGPLHKFIAAGAYHIRHGKDFSRGIPAAWSNLLDLRLAGIGYGSTRLYLTGNVTPDLAGDSALQDSLTEIFNVLNAPREEFFDAIHRIGPAATRGLAEFLGEVEKENTAVEFAWISQDNQSMRWDGRTDEITRLRATLEEAEANAHRTNDEISGIVTLLSVTGRIEIVPEGYTSKIKITYPKGFPEWVAGVSLHDRVIAPVETTTWFDPATEKERQRFALIGPIRRP